jgi:hypothetical protein
MFYSQMSLQHGSIWSQYNMRYPVMDDLENSINRKLRCPLHFTISSTGSTRHWYRDRCWLFRLHIRLNHVPWAVMKENGGKENETECQVTHYMARSLHVVARNTKTHVKSNGITFEKLRYPATLPSRRCRISQFYSISVFSSVTFQ